MKIIARIKGGLGNQLFCYAAARRLAIVNGAELVLDDLTGFARDHQFKRAYSLDRFAIPARRATPAERLEPLERYRRALLKWYSRRLPFEQRPYLEQESHDFDPRVLALRPRRTLYLDGLWQSEDYFKDVEETIRSDLRLSPPSDPRNIALARTMGARVSVAVHVRHFIPAGTEGDANVDGAYYRSAVAAMDARLGDPHYFIFSDNPDGARAQIAMAPQRATFVSHNTEPEGMFADMWLMSQCQHFVTANSTFSWWSAWRAANPGKIVVTPSARIRGLGEWGFAGQIPTSWVQI